VILDRIYIDFLKRDGFILFLDFLPIRLPKLKYEAWKVRRALGLWDGSEVGTGKAKDTSQS
jgi:hypothetical protein